MRSNHGREYKFEGCPEAEIEEKVISRWVENNKEDMLGKIPSKGAKRWHEEEEKTKTEKVSNNNEEFKEWFAPHLQDLSGGNRNNRHRQLHTKQKKNQCGSGFWTLDSERDRERIKGREKLYCVRGQAKTVLTPPPPSLLSPTFIFFIIFIIILVSNLAISFILKLGD